MTDIRFGGAYVDLGTKDSKLVAGLAAATTKVKAWANSAAKVGLGLTAFGAGLVMGLKKVANEVGEFEDQMASVSTMLAGADMDFMPKYREGIRKFSVEFGESTKTISKGLYDILSASVPPEKAMGVLESSMKAAVGGITDTGTAADALTTIINAYSLSAEDATDVSDLLFSVVKRGKTTFPELASSIGLVATNAGLSGVSMEEMGAALATMTRSGVSTSHAVTALNAMIMNFLKPTEDAKKAAVKFGLSLNTTTIKAEGFAGIMKRLSSLSTEQIAEIFPNIRALRGVLPLVNDYADFMKDIGVMADRAGTAQTAYNKAAASFGFQMKQVKQQLKAVSLELGIALMPLFKEFVSTLKGFLPKMVEWIKKNKELLIVLTKVGLALGGIGVALLALVGAGKIIALMINPLVMVAGAAILIAEAFGLIDFGVLKLINNMKIRGMRLSKILQIWGTSVLQVWEVIVGGAKWAWETLTDGFKLVTVKILDFFRTLGPNVALIIYQMLNKIISAINQASLMLNLYVGASIPIMQGFRAEIAEAEKLLEEALPKESRSWSDFFDYRTNELEKTIDDIKKEIALLDKALEEIENEDAKKDLLEGQAAKLKTKLDKLEAELAKELAKKVAEGLGKGVTDASMNIPPQTVEVDFSLKRESLMEFARSMQEGVFTVAKGGGVAAKQKEAAEDAEEKKDEEKQEKQDKEVEKLTEEQLKELKRNNELVDYVGRQLEGFGFTK